MCCPASGRSNFPSGVTNSFYRMLSYADFYGYFRRLYAAYTQFESLEETLNAYSGIPMEKLCSFLEVSAKSPQKKLNMFLRWMIRRDSEVDLGVWESFDRKDLIVPLDTHVCRVAYYFKLTDTETFSLKNARRITAALAEVFPDDPCLGDFALFWIRSQRGDLSCRNSIEVSIKPLLSSTYKTGSVSADSFYFLLQIRVLRFKSSTIETNA